MFVLVSMVGPCRLVWDAYLVLQVNANDPLMNDYTDPFEELRAKTRRDPSSDRSDM